MPVRNRKVRAVTAVTAVGAILWLASAAPGTTDPTAGDNLLGIQWQTNQTTQPTDSTEPTSPTDSGLGIQWQTNQTTQPTQPTAPTENGLGIQWETNKTTQPTPPGDGGLGIQWVTTNPEPDTTTTTGLNLDWNSNTTGQSAGDTSLDLIWTGTHQQQKVFGQVIRQAYWLVYGRDPTASELESDMRNMPRDGSTPKVEALVARYRQESPRYSKAIAVQALANAWGTNPLPYPPELADQLARPDLIHAEQYPRAVVRLGYYYALGRLPTEAETARGEATPPDAPSMKSAAAFAEELRSLVRQDSATRSHLIELAHLTAYKRQPTQAEQSSYSAALSSSGKLWSELTRELIAARDPQLPQKPMIVRTPNTAQHTQVIFRQTGGLVDQFRVLKLNYKYPNDWQQVGTAPPPGAGKEQIYSDTIQVYRATYKVCAVNALGEECSDPFDTTLKPYEPSISGEVALSATFLEFVVGAYGDDVTRLTLQQQEQGRWVDVQTEQGGDGFWYRSRVPNNAAITYRACATNPYGETCSTPRVLRTYDGSPKPPTNFIARAQNYTEWKLTWENAGYYKAVRLEKWNLQGNRWETLKQTTAAQTEYLDRNLSTDPWYEYRLCVTNDHGESCTPGLRVGKQFDHPTNFSQLDWGIYWFRCGTCRGSTRPSDKGTTSDGVKHVPGLPLEYYDPTKPTVIYVHGWQKGSTEAGARESMKSPTDDQSMMTAWKDAGWNVGIFYWNQFADDDWGFQPRTTEGKIDTQPISYRVVDSRGKAIDNGDRIQHPASHLFFMAYTDALRGYKGPEIRVVGHSLGTQMATMLTYYVHKSPDHAHLTPHRVALLDPWIGSEGRGNALADLMRDVQTNGKTVFEFYQTSSISWSPASWKPQTVFTRVHPMYADPLGGAHAAAIHWYFNSLSVITPTPSAGMSDQTLKSLKGCGCWFEQDAGKDSKAVTDDTFVRR